MKNKAKLILIGSVGLFVVLLAVAGVLLFRGIAQFKEADGGLDSSVQALRRLHERKPTPSDANIETEDENQQALEQWFTDLGDALRAGEVRSEQSTPSTFMSAFNEKRNRWIKHARRQSVRIADDFPFGFERYTKSGDLPAPPDVPRLTQQLLIIEQLSDILFEARIDGMKMIVRESFEGVGDSSGGRRGLSAPRRGIRGASGADGGTPTLVNPLAGVPREGALYAAFHFVLSFDANEKALMEILDKFASIPLFVVVTSLEIEMDDNGVQEALSSEIGAGKSGRAKAQSNVSSLFGGQPTTVSEEKPTVQLKDLMRRDRLRSGPDLEKPMHVTMALDVYRFLGEK